MSLPPFPSHPRSASFYPPSPSPATSLHLILPHPSSRRSFAESGVEKIVEEVASFVAKLQSMSHEELHQAGFARFACATKSGGPEDDREAIINAIVREVQGNLEYIIIERAEPGSGVFKRHT